VAAFFHVPLQRLSKESEKAYSVSRSFELSKESEKEKVAKRKT